MNQINFFVQVLIVLIAALLVQFFLPWWTLLIPCALVGFLYGKSSGSGFLVGFTAIFVLWLAAATLIQYQTGSDLPGQISGLFPGKSTIVLFVLTGLVGGLAGGFSSMTGYLVRRLL